MYAVYSEMITKHEMSKTKPVTPRQSELVFNFMEKHVDQGRIRASITSANS